MGKIIKKILITTGMVSMMLISLGSKEAIGGMVSYASEQTQTYSNNWRIDEGGSWRYYLNDGTVATDAWVQDSGEWYLLGSDGIMRTGIFKSNGGRYYLLDTVRGTGTYGKLLKNGRVYKGIVLNCDTSSDYEGALSQETIESLRAVGIDFSNVPDVQNTKHVTNGQIDTSPSSNETNTSNAHNNNTDSSSDDGFDYDYNNYEIDWDKYDPADYGGATGWHPGDFH